MAVGDDERSCPTEPEDLAGRLEAGLREHADAGDPLVTADPGSPAAIAVHQAARGIIAQTPVELPLMQSVAADTPVTAAPISGTELPVVQAGG